MSKLYILGVAVLLIACNSFHSLQSGFVRKSPYEQYRKSLEDANLLATPMATAWQEAGRRSLYDSVQINLPFSEAGVFQAAEPQARSYSFPVKDGQVLKVTGMVQAQANAHLFLDLFVWKDTIWTQLTHADSALTLSYEFDRDAQCLLRLQPELLVNAYYSVTISLTPVLINPVSGASNRSIGSFYGDARDGGKRKHEGVDIFAPKGTPIIAPAAGVVTRVGTSNLGGKVVWMQDGKRGHSYYFAHLDEQLVKAGQKLKQGDTLGLVGNTGNARTTPAHLHFGIYQARAKDPIHYLLTQDALKSDSPLDTLFREQVYRVTARRSMMRTGPGPKYALKETLNKNDYVKIIAQSDSWYRVALADERQGYVEKKQVGEAIKGKARKLDASAVLLSRNDQQSVPLAYLDKATAVEILASYKSSHFVRTKEGQVGWLFL
ncbi:peptidoglycan DD-metalloendopeptidase family protein [Dawidia soli]|uniref:Peptidoglycan DD-metalloendopeptidase family protein n=1 Tax=Dawidia soli TaxID=2782352 RepID=A0AAP2DC78_9BACT|nr:peptidoglycan DD-metalloendopeptidase family protein [Dawidia soli]MBT1689079.1 peptidoglycan DD-metalloendopeptidase family protein [Dawidia soli]